MSGRVCDKHQEYCPSGECRWCEPVAATATGLGLMAVMPSEIYGGITDPGFSIGGDAHKYWKNQSQAVIVSMQAQGGNPKFAEIVERMIAQRDARNLSAMERAFATISAESDKTK